MSRVTIISAQRKFRHENFYFVITLIGDCQNIHICFNRYQIFYFDSFMFLAFKKKTLLCPFF